MGTDQYIIHQCHADQSYPEENIFGVPGHWYLEEQKEYNYNKNCQKLQHVPQMKD